MTDEKMVLLDVELGFALVDVELGFALVDVGAVLEASGVRLLVLAMVDARMDEGEVTLAVEDKPVVDDGKSEDMESVNVEEGSSMLEASNVDEDVVEATRALAVMLGSTDEVSVNVDSMEEGRSDEDVTTSKELVDDAVSEDAVIVADVATREEEMLSLEAAVAEDRNSVDEVGGRVSTVLDPSCVVVDATAVSLVVLTALESVADAAADVEAAFESVGASTMLESVVEETIALSVVEATMLLAVLDTAALSVVLEGAMLSVVDTITLSVVDGSKLSDVDAMMFSVVEETALFVITLPVVGAMTLLVVDAMVLSLVGTALASVVEMTALMPVVDAALLSVVDTILLVPDGAVALASMLEVAAAAAAVVVGIGGA